MLWPIKFGNLFAASSRGCQQPESSGCSETTGMTSSSSKARSSMFVVKRTTTLMPSYEGGSSSDSTGKSSSSVKPRFVRLRPQRYPQSKARCSELIPTTSEEADNWRKRWYGSKARRDTGHDPAKCQRRAAISINGQPYCRQHAAEYALRLILMEQDEEEQKND